MLSKKLILWGIAIMFASASHAADAGTTSTLTVNTTVLSGCAVNSAGVINLIYDPMSNVPTTASTAGSMTVTCSAGTAWGVYSDQSVVTRIMNYVGTPITGTAVTMLALPYALYNDLGVSLAVTNTSGQTIGIGTGTPQAVIIKAVVAPKINVAVGQYTQTINLVVVY